MISTGLAAVTILGPLQVRPQSLLMMVTYAVNTIFVAISLLTLLADVFNPGKFS